MPFYANNIIFTIKNKPYMDEYIAKKGDNR